MSTTIDERVVEMRFDNKQFESNVSTSMSTLKKLKESLKFTGATKGLEEIESASKRVNMSGLGGAVDSVKAKFSALDVVAVTALANITNSAVNTGKRLVASLSVDQISSGWRKFGEKTTSVATLVAQGNAIEDVNKQLNLLNWFTDETSYNFTDMVANIAKFTASGKGLDESVTAMEGIATWAALSGQNAMTASRAMYQLSQAMGAGVMRREDYRSIQNASMDTKEFRENCIEAAIALGTLKDNGDGTYSSLVSGAKQSSFTISQFADNLTEGLWLTSDVMMSVYTKYASAVNGIYEAVEEKGFDNASQVLTEIHDKADQLKTDGMSDTEAIDAAIKELGYTLEDGSFKFDHFGVKAFEAAQQARTFTDVIDSVKDAVSTGWMNTFEKIFGDSNQATELWTMMANELWDTFAGGGERRNNILDQAMGSGWDKLSERITDAGLEVDVYESKVKELAKVGGEDVDGLITKYGSLSDAFKNGALDTDYLKKALDSLSGGISEVTTGLSVDLENIFPGKYGESVIAWGSDATDAVTKIQTALTELGYDLGEYGVNGKFGNETWKAVAEFQKNAGLKVTGQVDQKTLDALKEAGASIKTIGENSEVASVEIDDLLDSLSRPSGRELVFDIISNSLKTINGILGAFREAWAEVFSEEGVASGVYNTLAAIRNFTEGLFELDEDGNKVLKHFDELKTTFKGLISVLDLVVSIAGGAVKFAFKALGAIFGGFNLNILGATSGVGEFLIKLADIIKEGEYIGKAFDWLLGKFEAGVKWIKNWFTELLTPVKEIPFVKETASALKDLSAAFNKFKEGEYALSDLGAAIKKTALRILNAVPAFQKWFDAFKETPVFQKWVAAFTEFQTVVQKFKNGEIGFSELLSGIGDFISKALTSIPIIEKYVTAIRNWFAVFKETPAVQKLVGAINSIVEAFKKLKAGEIDPSEFGAALGENLGKAISAIPEVIKGAAGGFIEGARQIASDFIQGFQNGISDSISGVISSIVEFCVNFATAFASALGIHSPSVIAYEDGINFIQGFINGLKAMIGFVVSVLKKIGEVIVKVFKSLWDSITDENGDIEWGKLFAAGILVSAVWFLKQIATAFGSIADPIDGVNKVLNRFSKVLKSFSKVLNSVAWDIKAQAIKKMAIAVAILAATVLVLSQVKDVGKLWNAVGVVFALAAILVGLAVALQLLSKSSVAFDFANKKFDISGLKTSLLQIALAIVLVAASVKLLGGIDDTTATKGFERLAAISVGMLLFVEILGAISNYSGDVSGIGGMMLKLSAAMILMFGVCKLASKLSVKEMLKGAAFVAGFVVFVKFLVKALTVGKDSQLAGVTGLILSVSLSLALMVGVCKLASMLSYGEMWKGAVFAGGFAMFVAFLVQVLTMGNDKEIAKVSGLILSVSFSLMLMVGVCKLVSMLSYGEMWKGAVFASAFAIFVGFLVNILKVGSEEKIANVASTLLAMSVAIAIMAAVAVALSFIPLGGLAKGIIFVGLLSGMMALMAKSLKGAQNAKGAIMMMAIAIGIMAAAVFALSFIDTVKVMANAAAMSAMMVAFAFMIKCLKGLKTGEAIKGALGLLALMAPLVAFVGILYLLDGVEGSTEKIISLTAAMAAFTIMAAVLAAVGHAASFALMGAGALLLLMVPLVAFVGILHLLDGVDGIKDKIISLVAAMAAMTLLLAVLTVIGAFGPAAIIGVGSLLALLVAIGGLSVGIGAAMEAGVEIDKFINNGLPILERLATGIGTMMGNFVSGFGTAISEGFVTMSENLSTCMDELAKACDKAKNVDGSAFNGVETLLDVIGDIALATVGTGLSDVFTFGGTSMEKFQKDGAEFFTAMKEIGAASAGVTLNEESMDSIIAIAGKLVELQSSIEPIGGVIDWFKGRDDLGTFGANVKSFIDSMKTAYSSLDGVETFNAAAMDQIVTAATSLSAIQSSLDSMGGVVSWFIGRDDLGTFGTTVSSFIESMKTAMSTLGDSQFNVDSLDSVISAAVKLSEFSGSLEPMGGVIAWFTGRTDLGTFGTNIGLFADAMGKLKTGMGENGISEAVTTSITNAGNAIIALQNALPTEHLFDGKMNLTEFSTYVTNFGKAMSGFREAGTNVDDSAISTTISAACRIKDLIADLSDLDTKGLKDFIGGFGSDGAAVNIAQCMSKFSKEVSDIDITAVATSVTAATRLKALINALADLDTSGIENFKPGDVSDALKSYSNTVASLNTAAIDRSIAAANKIKAFISSLSSFKTGGVNSFKSAVENLSSVNLSGISDMMTEYSATMQTSGVTLASSLNSGLQSGLAVINNTISSILSMVVSSIRSKASAFRAAGSTLASNLASGISSRRGTVASAASGVASSAASNARNYWGFYYAGSYCMDGLRDGINKNKYKVFNAVEQLAEDLSEKFRITVQIGSPSKLFAEYGRFLDEGLAIGIKNNTNVPVTAASRLGESTIQTMQDAISRAADMFSFEGDFQPTIRPVVDLSDVKTGVAAIDSMMLANRNVGLMADFRAISSNINARSQNRANDDIISAINKLGAGLENNRGDTYNFGDFTYDDGSEVADAVGTLVRYAKIGRRV